MFFSSHTTNSGFIFFLIVVINSFASSGTPERPIYNSSKLCRYIRVEQCARIFHATRAKFGQNF